MAAKVHFFQTRGNKKAVTICNGFQKLIKEPNNAIGLGCHGFVVEVGGLADEGVHHRSDEAEKFGLEADVSFCQMMRYLLPYLFCVMIFRYAKTVVRICYGREGWQAVRSAGIHRIPRRFP